VTNSNSRTVPATPMAAARCWANAGEADILVATNTVHHAAPASSFLELAVLTSALPKIRTTLFSNSSPLVSKYQSTTE
jgi:hypothetical protein